MDAENPIGASGPRSKVPEHIMMRTLAEMAEGARVQALWQRQAQLKDWIAAGKVKPHPQGWLVNGQIVEHKPSGIWAGNDYCPSEEEMNFIGLAVMYGGDK